MKILLSVISTRGAGVTKTVANLVELYIERSARYTPTAYRSFLNEAKLLDFLEDSATRTRPYLIVADSTGQQITSMELATSIVRAFDGGTQLLVLAIGPADGWSAVARQRADRIIAFGKITLPHELAAVVAAEQIYRALTIRAGHPYHSGH